MKGKLQTSLWRALQTTLTSVDPVQSILRKFNGELGFLGKQVPQPCGARCKGKRDGTGDTVRGAGILCVTRTEPPNMGRVKENTPSPKYLFKNTASR